MNLRWKRRYTAASDSERCCENILLRDGSGARCMHRRTKHTFAGESIPYCTQHARLRGLIEKDDSNANQG